MGKLPKNRPDLDPKMKARSKKISKQDALDFLQASIDQVNKDLKNTRNFIKIGMDRVRILKKLKKLVIK